MTDSLCHSKCVQIGAKSLLMRAIDCLLCVLSYHGAYVHSCTIFNLPVIHNLCDIVVPLYNRRMLCTIIGCGPRMGDALARIFVEAGFDLALVSRTDGFTEPLARELAKSGRRIVVANGDATEEDSIAQAFNKIRSTAGDTEILIYNVATMVKTPPSELTPKEVVQTLPAMFFGALLSTREVLPAMHAAGKGTLLYTGGGFGIVPATFTASHSVGKAALRNWVFNLHEELKPEGIHAATVTITRPVGDGGPYDRRAIARHYLELHEQPLGRWDREIIHKEL